MRDSERPTDSPVLNGGQLRAMHLALAGLLRERPELIVRAREATRLLPLKAHRRRWRAVLDRPIERVVSALTSRRLQGVLHASPFLHVLTEEEQQLLLERGSEQLAARQRARESVAARQRSKTKAESKLAQLRLDRGWSQSEMARRAGIAPGTYWKLERKRISNPPVGYLAACARALDVPLEAVVEEELLAWGTLRDQRLGR